MVGASENAYLPRTRVNKGLQLYAEAGHGLGDALVMPAHPVALSDLAPAFYFILMKADDVSKVRHLTDTRAFEFGPDRQPLVP